MKMIRWLSCSCAIMALCGCQLPFGPKTNPFYSAVLREYPNHTTVLFLQGEAFLLKGQFEAAEPYFEKLIQMQNDNPAAWLGLGQCRLELHRFGAAGEAFKRSLELRGSQEGHLGLASSMLLGGQIDAARTEADLIEKQYGMSAQLLRLRGDIALVAKMPQESRDYYRRSLSGNPNQPDLQDRLSDLEEYLTSTR